MKPRTLAPSEFELDLAPLLAVMVKLVPVLLISSAFVQVMVIETDIPQAVKEAIAKSDDQNMAQVTLEINKMSGLRLTVQDQAHQNTQAIPNTADGGVDLDALQATLVKVKAEHPEVFRLSLRSAPDVSYRDLVKIMDEARRSKDKNIHFPVLNSKTNETTETDFMFPDVVFANVMETT